jgi:hypothetical protein
VTHLYLIQSPLQAINAFEARQSIADGAERHAVIVVEQKEAETNRIMANTLRTLGWTPWRTVPFRSGNVGKMWEWMRLRLALWPLRRDVSRVYIGNYVAGMAVAAANLFHFADHYLLDDGTSSINFPAFRYDGVRPEHLPPARSVPWLGYRPQLPPKLTFFSVYDVPVRAPDAPRRNELSFLRNAIRFDPEGPVLFIGSCMPDVKVITFDQFFTLFRDARAWLGDREVHYFPHRRELMDRKLSFFKELGVKITKPELPFELELIYGKTRPALVSTFYSTAFDTLRLLLAGKPGNLLSFNVPLHWIQTEAHRRIARHSYAEYRGSAEIRVIEDYWVGEGRPDGVGVSR